MATTHRPMARLVEVVPEPRESAVLDAVDRRLLVLLAQDSRTSQRQLSRQLRMSPPAIGERIARLERAGVIRGYTVDVDWTALGYATCYLVVTATPSADLAVIMRALVDLPEVEDVSIITGSIDMLARLRVRDHAHLREILVNRVWQIEGMQRTETLMSLVELNSEPVAVSLHDVDGDGDRPGRSKAEPSRTKAAGRGTRTATRPSRKKEA